MVHMIYYYISEPLELLLRQAYKQKMVAMILTRDIFIWETSFCEKNVMIIVCEDGSVG